MRQVKQFADEYPDQETGLLARGRRQAAGHDQDEVERRADLARSERARVARAAAYDLELGEDGLAPEALRRVAGDAPVFPDHSTALYAFEVDGLAFVAGFYWHGNPGDRFFMAVRRPLRKRWWRPRRPGPLVWPPPHPRSASNTGWAPAGYATAYSPARVAAVVDGVVGRG